MIDHAHYKAATAPPPSSCNMTLAKLTYTPHDKHSSTEHPSSYVLLVDEDAYQQHKSDASIPLAQVVDTFTIFKYENPGMSGTLERPSKRELEEVFGLTNDDELVEFMLKNGQPHGSKMMV